MANKLWFSAICNLILAILEVIFGIWTGSITLLLEAGHNGVDVLTLTLSALTARKVRLDKNSKLPAFVGLVNVITLNLWVIYAFLEAIHRLLYPSKVETGPFFIFGLLSLAVNLVMGALLHGKQHGYHVHTASLHLLVDAGGTIAFFAAGVLVLWTGWYQWDSIISMSLGVVIVISTIPLALECIQEFRV